MTVLEALKDKTPNYYNNTKSLLWDNMGCLMVIEVTISTDCDHRIHNL